MRGRTDGAGRRKEACWSGVYGQVRGSGIQCPEGGQFCRRKEGRAHAHRCWKVGEVVWGRVEMIFYFLTEIGSIC